MVVLAMIGFGTGRAVVTNVVPEVDFRGKADEELLNLMAGRKKAFFWAVLRTTAPGRRDLEIGPDKERGEPPWQDW